MHLQGHHRGLAVKSLHLILGGELGDVEQGSIESKKDIITAEMYGADHPVKIDRQSGQEQSIWSNNSG